MTRWEYKSGKYNSAEHCYHDFNELGREGWEVFFINPDTRGYMAKRPLKDTTSWIEYIPDEDTIMTPRRR